MHGGRLSGYYALGAHRVLKINALLCRRKSVALVVKAFRGMRARRDELGYNAKTERYKFLSDVQRPSNRDRLHSPKNLFSDFDIRWIVETRPMRGRTQCVYVYKRTGRKTGRESLRAACATGVCVFAVIFYPS